MSTVPQPATRAAAISLVTAALRGDTDAIRFMVDSCDEEDFVALLHAALALARALALRLRSPEGLMAVDVWLAEASHDEHRSHDSRIAARLLLGHAQTCYPPTETITAAETFADLYSIGAHTFNAACVEADFQVVDVFCVALAMWRSLLPEADIDARAAMVCNVAGQLWGGAEPAPPKTIQKPEGTPTLRIQDENEPRATLAAPIETRVRQWDDGPPPRPTIPADAKVSLRGLAIRRQQERGVDVIYG